MTPEQCRAARAVLGWSQDQLAQVSQVHKSTITLFELGKRPPYARSLDDLRDAFAAAGVIFDGENGVRLKKADRVIRATWDPPPKR